MERRGEREAGNDRELLELSTIAVISLLPVYHRFYDATLLVLPLCWAFVWLRRERASAALSLGLMLPFLIPGGTLLETMQIAGRIPRALTNHWWWEAVVMPHQVWALLFLSIVLLREMGTDGAGFRSRRAFVAAAVRRRCTIHPVSDRVLSSHARSEFCARQFASGGRNAAPARRGPGYRIEGFPRSGHAAPPGNHGSRDHEGTAK